MPPRARQPQDHKPKAVKNGGSFTFDHDGKTYRLPSAAKYAEKSEFSGGDFMDAVLKADTTTEMRMTMSVFEAAKNDIDDAYDALRTKPVNEFLQTVGEWMQASHVET